MKEDARKLDSSELNCGHLNDFDKQRLCDTKIWLCLAVLSSARNLAILDENNANAGAFALCPLSQAEGKEDCRARRVYGAAPAMCFFFISATCDTAWFDSGKSTGSPNSAERSAAV